MRRGNESKKVERASDGEIVGSVLQGRKDDFALIVGRYQSKIAALAYKMGVESSSIEDVVSEIMLKVYKNLGRYRSEFAFSTWIYRISTNHIIDFSKKKRPLPIEEADLVSPEDIFSDHHVRERADEVRDAIALLPERYRTVITLKYLEDRQIDEIAEILGKKESTVKVWLMRGRNKLRELIIENYPHLGEEHDRHEMQGHRKPVG